MSSSLPGQNGQGRPSASGWLRGASHEGVGPLGAARAHDDPAARQRIEAQLVHRCTLSGACRPVYFALVLMVIPPPLRYRFRWPQKRQGTGAVTWRPRAWENMAVMHHQPQGAAFDIVLLLHVACVVVGLVTTVTAAATASRLRRLVVRGRTPARGAPALLPAGRQLGGPHDLRHPGIRLRPPRHEPGCLRPARRVGAGRCRPLRRRGPRGGGRAVAGRAAPAVGGGRRHGRARPGGSGGPGDPGADLDAIASAMPRSWPAPQTSRSSSSWPASS